MESIKKIVRTLQLRAGIVGDLLGFLVKRKHYWMIPLILLILFISLFLVFGHATGLAPFIYPFF